MSWFERFFTEEKEPVHLSQVSENKWTVKYRNLFYNQEGDSYTILPLVLRNCLLCKDTATSLAYSIAHIKDTYVKISIKAPE